MQGIKREKKKFQQADTKSVHLKHHFSSSSYLFYALASTAATATRLGSGHL